MVDVYREKPIRLAVKVTVPVKEHPKVIFFLLQKNIQISLSLLRFRDSMLGSLYIKIYFLRETKKMIPLHNLDISVILIFHLPVNHTRDDHQQQMTKT